MPKKPRQAHIPQQSKRHRTRRPTPTQASPPPFTSPPLSSESAILGSAPVAAPPARPIPRPGIAPEPQAPAASAARAVPGQLPTFERAFLMRELRQIGLTAGSLLALVILLAVILR